MEHITLFTDILPEEQERMRICFHAREMTFRNGETIMEYSSSMKKIGLILYGRAILYCCDTEGNQYYVCAAEETKIMFIDYEHVIKRCDQACYHHSQMVSNLLQLTAIQSRQQNERIYMLSRSSTRKKLMAYLNALSTEKHSKDLKLPMSYTALAQYLSVDRSAMTRELKNLEMEGIIEKNGKQIHIN